MGCFPLVPKGGNSTTPEIRCAGRFLLCEPLTIPLYFSSHSKGSHFGLTRIVVKFSLAHPLIFLARQNFHSLFADKLSSSELIIVFYLIDMCNEWGFTTECEKSISEFLQIDVSSSYRRIRKLKKLDVVKKVEYNGRVGFMINPLYCYQGALHLKRFRANLWKEEKIYTSSRPSNFYGPPIHDEQTFRNKAIQKHSS